LEQRCLSCGGACFQRFPTDSSADCIFDDRAFANMCDELKKLMDAYHVAVLLFSRTLDAEHAAIGTTRKEEYDRLHGYVEQARSFRASATQLGTAHRGARLR